MLGEFKYRDALRRLIFVFGVFGSAIFLCSCSDERTTPDGSSTAATETKCRACHGTAETNAAPPRDASGNTSTSSRGVGAHQSHVVESSISAAIECSACHTVPEDFDHATTKPSKINFSDFVKTGDLSPEFNGTTCTNTYCHGSSITDTGVITEPKWTTVDGTQAACGAACHGLPPHDGTHLASWENLCNLCHSLTIGGSDPHVITNKALHINGQVDFND